METTYEGTRSRTDLLKDLAGLTDRQARKVLACFELAHEYKAEGFDEPILTKPIHVYEALSSMRYLKQEHLVGLYLDSRNRLLAKETITIGSLNTTRTAPREALYPAIARLACGYIVGHNHPSGQPEPSEEDVSFTRSLWQASDLVGIPLYDHVIIARGGCRSLRELHPECFGLR